MSQPLYEVSHNTISCFHLIAHYVSGGEFFTGNYILWHPPHWGIIFDQQATISILTLTLAFGLLTRKSIGFQQSVKDYYWARFQVILISFRFTVLTYTHIVIKWLLYVRHHTTSLAWINHHPTSIYVKYLNPEELYRIGVWEYLANYK